VTAWVAGLDRVLAQGRRRLAGRRYGLLAHGASLTAELVPAHLALAGAGVPPTVLFGPEHGFYGVEQDMVPAEDARDPWTELPIRSLYAADEASLRPLPAAFDGLDLLVVDLQDVGARYYTYAATAVWAGEAALAAGCEVWVLDRPNPLGAPIEGNLRQPAYESFVGAFKTPVRHGLTLGELVLLEALRRGWDRHRLSVWALEGWEPDEAWSGRPFVAPSPNLPSLDVAWLYPGACLVEGTELSEGRGTTRPFRLVGAPWLDPRTVAELLAARGLPGLAFIPTYFRPQHQKHAGTVCGGVEIVVTDPTALAPYRFGCELLFALREADPERFGWRRHPYEFVADRPAVDLLAGSDALRRAVDAGDRSALEAWMATWPEDEREFRRECEEIRLYRRGGW
jgi:uncharacterized protein YbbC (DUF1343 family)